MIIHVWHYLCDAMRELHDVEHSHWFSILLSVVYHPCKLTLPIAV